MRLQGEADFEANCVGCGSARVTERLEVTAQGYRRFRCRECSRQFNERSCDGAAAGMELPPDTLKLPDVLGGNTYLATLRRSAGA
jgi:putative transposase